MQGTYPHIQAFNFWKLTVFPVSRYLVGTNTYLIGQTNPYILIDAGQGEPEYIPVLERALRSNKPPQSALPDVSDIILTHRHHDHIDGLPSVLSLLSRLWTERCPGKAFHPPRIHKIPLTTPDAHLDTVAASIPTNHRTPAFDGDTIHTLKDGQKLYFTASPPSNEAYLQVLHTPGHTPDSLCLYLPLDRALFTADSVLGHGTAVFEDLGDYMASLRKMIEFNDSSPRDGQAQPNSKGRYDTVYPGHGNIILNGPKILAMYLQHRIEREQQILEVLKRPPPAPEESEGGSLEAIWTTWSLVGTIYAGYPQSLWEPAAHTADLHLKKLESDGRVKRGSGSGKDTQWIFLKG